ncbi:NUDIX domain-containing protein [Saccharicrinis fermentans]|uniref:Bifunctional NMN adenylyltransferase/Nudix hydrolase n=1 Tax=Saccharicrinis fermentans DSM 9555 = JCM 21142 TaxID=869213 RepID=W7Y4T2_9BACT|nr:NUDIX hydrolase [Saccharicrinis fermentans]GAF03097.1 bifunctional NMN adenylyltransferase/Nudix hydrolase [Saccharicrinis fermentans DSM 9555 = JCM 21142]
MRFTYKYPRPAVTVDVILITKGKQPQILLIERKHEPYEGCWAFPGGFLDMDEDLETAALRELQEETHIQNIQIKQFKSYGGVQRDPRGRTISVVFYAFIEDVLMVQPGDDASKAKWFSLEKIPTLAFDHSLILNEFKETFLS